MDHFNTINTLCRAPYRNLFLILVWLFILTPWPSFAENAPENAAPKPNTEIHVTADYLISDRNARYAEFQGNVVATQQESVLTSDRLKITFLESEKDDTEKNSENTGNPAGAIDTIVATGHVKMVMEDKTAWAENATFNRVDDTIILTGGNPRVVSGKSSLTGEKIVIKRSTGQVTAFGSKNKRVDAFFNQEDVEKAQKKQP